MMLAAACEGFLRDRCLAGETPLAIGPDIRERVAVDSAAHVPKMGDCIVCH